MRFLAAIACLIPWLASAGSIQPLADINRALGAVGNVSAAPVNGRWILPFADPGYNTSAWSTDGTDEGTFPLPGQFPSGNFVAFKGLVYFWAWDVNNGGNTLWSTDGTEAGTVAIRTAADHANVVQFVATPSYIYFLASGSSVWRTDGTSAGTVKLADLDGPHNLVAFGDSVLFIASGGTTGDEVWISDGTTAGTHVLKDIVPGTGWSEPTGLGVVGTRAFFMARPAAGADPVLWTTDGTEAGTVQVSSAFPGPALYPAIAFQGCAYLFVRGPDFTISLIRTDGTAAGTTAVASNLNPWRTPVVTSSGIYFPALTPSWSLWQSDGTPAGTGPMNAPANANLSSIDSLLVFQDQVYFSAYTTAPFRQRVFRVDRTGTPSVVDAGFDGTPYIALDSLLLTDFIYVRVSNGDPSTSRILKSRTGVTRMSSQCGLAPAALNGIAIFFADDADHGCELWRSDGTPAGTSLIKDLVPGENGLFMSENPPPNIVTAGGHAFFTASNALWASDGTSTGTLQLRGSVSAQPVAAGALACFIDDANSLWKSDGTAAGTTLVVAFPPGSTYLPQARSLVAIGSTIFFIATNPSDGTAVIYRSDGTASGTRVLASIGAYSLYVTASRLYAVSYDIGQRYLWQVDPGNGSVALIRSLSLTWGNIGSPVGVLGDMLFISMSDIVNENYQSGLYAVNGTSLERVADWTEVNGAAADGAFYFTSNGALYRTNGTSAGTSALNYGYPSKFTSAFGSVFFIGNSYGLGDELWIANRSGARPVQDYVPGPAPLYVGPGAHPFAVLPGGLVFHAGSDPRNQEPVFYDFDQVADAVPFPAAGPVAPGAVIISTPTQATGFDVTLAGSMTGGAACVSSTPTCSCDLAPFGAQIQVAPGDYICMRHTASPTPGGTAMSTLRIAGIDSVFTSTTGYPQTLTVQRTGAGSGDVRSGSPGIDCGTDCSETLPFGSTMTLTAQAARGSIFAGWSGACSGSRPCTVTFDGAKSLTARFEKSSLASGLPDLDGDGRADLLWHHPTAGDGAWIMSGARASSTGGIPAPAAGATIRLAADFDGDGHTDLLWRTPQGAYYVTLMNGLTVTATAKVLDGGSGWEVLDKGDFNGDGRIDLVWRGPGNVYGLWLMNGTSISAYGALTPPTPGATAMLFGDFDGDGKTDIVWRGTDGSVNVTLMDGLGTIASATLLGGGTAWAPVMTGDFNGDGKTDLIWRHADGSYGLWLMNGVATPTYFVFLGANTGWTLMFTRDLDGDGKSDVIWQHADGSWAASTMDGGARTGTKVWMYARTGWNIVASDDLDGDGKADLVWRSDSGQYAVWLMNGLDATAYAYILDGGTGWELLR